MRNGTEENRGEGKGGRQRRGEGRRGRGERETKGGAEENEGHGESARRRGEGGRETEGAGGGESGKPGGEGRAPSKQPSCKPRGINGRQLARLSTVFLALPAEAQQSACAGRGASAAQRARPGCRAAEPEREGAASTSVSGTQAARRSRERPPGPARRRAGGEEVGGGAPGGLPGAQARGPSRAQSEPASVLFCSSPDTGRISTAARSQPLRIAKKGRKICGIN